MLYPNSLMLYPSSTTPGNTETFPDLSTTPPGYVVPSPNLSTTPPRDPTSKYSSTKKAQKQAIGKISDWISKGKTSYSMTKRNKITTLEMNRDHLNNHAIKFYYDTQYLTDWKASTIELRTNISEGNQGNCGFDANAVAKK